MADNYEICPKIGVARLGNSTTEFYLSPETIGGRPIECDQAGNPIMNNGKYCYVSKYKDSVGRVKRQAAKFRIIKNGKEFITLSDDNIEKIVWTVHIANKKPIWYAFSELQGNLQFGETNSYQNQHIPLNNPDVVNDTERKKLMIDPGPRSIDTSGDVVEFSRYNIPKNYQYGSFPPVGAGGQQIDSLGELRMDSNGNLVALGAFGSVTGSAEITSFKGASGYWDDISDGYVVATIHFKDGTSIDASPGWLLVGSPKFAPELVNITTLYDTMYDIGLRYHKGDSEIYDAQKYKTSQLLDHPVDGYPLKEYNPFKGYNPDYVVDFGAQIKPIIERIAGYRWVADIPYLNDFGNPHFDLSDNSEKNMKNRMKYFSYFRVPVLPEDYKEWINKVTNGPNTLFSQDGIPLMPLNSGDNSVTNKGPIYKFETLSPTQYFFLHQWACGKFVVNKNNSLDKNQAYINQLNEADLGNCVGAPFSPGIETTWISRAPHIYDAPIHLQLAHFSSNAELRLYYNSNGLSMTEDEQEGAGCEPGDLTKRMAIPWQADFSQCTVQTPNISPNSMVNQFADGTGIEVPPTYYVYWWPPQSPMHVTSGIVEPDGQILDAIVSKLQSNTTMIPAGLRVPYQRGIDSAADVIGNWFRLGFIVNQGTSEYPYFVEKERGLGGIYQYQQSKQQSVNKTIEETIITT